MAPPNEGSPRRGNYGSVDGPEQPASHSNLLLRSSRLSITSNSSPASAWAQQHLPQETRTRNLHEIEGARGVSRQLVVAFVCGFAFMVGGGVSWNRITGSGNTAAAPGGVFVQGPSSLPSVAVGDEDGDDVALEFTALNYYHVRDGKPGQDYPWLKNVKLLEPHRDTTLAVVGAKEGFEYRWEVLWKDSNDSSEVAEVQATATGAVTIVILAKLDENTVVLEEVDGNGKVTNRLEETVMVKYVRREIRTLTADEKQELMDAMFQLWSVRVDGGNGEELYGQDYADIYAINRLHFMGTTNDTCDHLHDGLGFLVSHALITNTFEFSLQLVNPKLTVPYWDFTMETTAATELEYDPTQPNTRTELLSSSWFGSSDVENDGMIKDGRWKNMQIPMEKENDPGVIATDIYGKLRSPWSTNDRPFLTRGLNKECLVLVDDYLEWPTCEIHYNLTLTNDDFYSWVWDSLGSPHGTLHLWLGGVMDCKDAYSKTASLVGPDIAKTLSFLAVGHRKSLFYNGIWQCEGDKVSVDVKPEELLSNGTCGCLGYDLTQGDDYQFLIPQLTSLEFLLGECSEDVKREVVELICSGVVALGDMDQSSSTFDPMFWAMHPTMERLWQFAVVTGQVTEFTWADQDVIVTNPDGTTTTEYISSYYETCYGHRGSDTFPYEILDEEIDGFEIKTGIRSNRAKGNNLTNREVLPAFDPRSNSMNYVYDTFKWDHCKPEGYDFDDAWGETAPSAKKTFYQTVEPLSAVYTNLKREMAEQMNGAPQCTN